MADTWRTEAQTTGECSRACNQMHFVPHPALPLLPPWVLTAAAKFTSSATSGIYICCPSALFCPALLACCRLLQLGVPPRLPAQRPRRPPALPEQRARRVQLLVRRRQRVWRGRRGRLLVNACNLASLPHTQGEQQPAAAQGSPWLLSGPTRNSAALSCPKSCTTGHSAANHP